MKKSDFELTVAELDELIILRHEVFLARNDELIYEQFKIRLAQRCELEEIRLSQGPAALAQFRRKLAAEGEKASNGATSGDTAALEAMRQELEQAAAPGE